LNFRRRTLAADDPAALDLLTLIAWCAPEPVPLSLLTEHPESVPGRLRQTISDPLAFTRCTRLLHRLGMATAAPHSVQMHRVPAMLLRARTRDDHQDSAGWAGCVIRLLRAAAPPRPWNNPSVWPRWQQLLPHVLIATDEAREVTQVGDDFIWLLDRAAEYMHTRGEPGKAVPLGERAYAICKGRWARTIPRLCPQPTASPSACVGWATTGRPAN
jgi:hypothetical protein